MSVHDSSELAGKLVVSQDGREIGEIDALYVDVDTWRVPAIKVKVRKEVLEDLSLRRPWIGTQVIRIPTAQVAGLTDTVVLGVPLAELSFVGGEPEDQGEQEDDPGGELPDSAA
jgi:sporulation protein YlmC with PRC-barrel domain